MHLHVAFSKYYGIFKSLRYSKRVHNHEKQRVISTTCSAGFQGQRGFERNMMESKPILLVDIMDTIVVDPFYKKMPTFFKMTFDELLTAKHPTAWVEFEKGDINEQELCKRFFKDGRKVDADDLSRFMYESYTFVTGMQGLLESLKNSGIEMHAMSNYPVWYELIEERLDLSRYLEWTFVSCHGPMKGLRKPDPKAFKVAMDTLGREPHECVLIDDRPSNVDAAAEFGLKSLLFKNTAELESDLRALGFDF